MLVIAYHGDDEEYHGEYHRDEGDDYLTSPIACLLVVDFVATRALRYACVLMEIEASNTSQAIVCCAFACVAWLKAL